MKLSELLNQRDCYTEDPESGNIYPKEGFVFHIDQWKFQRSFILNDNGKYYFNYGHYNDYKHTITESDEIKIIPDPLLIDCSVRFVTDHSDRWYIQGPNKKEILPANDDLEDNLNEFLWTKFQASNIDYSHGKGKINFKIHLLSTFDETMFNLIEFGIVNQENFQIWLDNK